MTDQDTTARDDDLSAALGLIRRIQEHAAWLAREIDLNANISPDLTSRIHAAAADLVRMAAARGN